MFVCMFCMSRLNFFNLLLLPFNKDQKSYWSFTNRFLREKLWNDIGLRFWNLALKWWLLPRRFFIIFFGLCHSLLMDIGKDQQQHPSVHSGRLSKVPFLSTSGHLTPPFCSPSVHHMLPSCFDSAPLMLPFHSPSAPLETWNLVNRETQPLGNSEIHTLGNWAVFNQFQQFSVFFKRFQTISTAFNCFQSLSTIFSCFQQFSTAYSRFQPFSTFSTTVSLFSPFLPLQPFSTIPSHFNQFKPFSTVLTIFNNYLKPFFNLFKKLFCISATIWTLREIQRVFPIQIVKQLCWQ